MTTKATKATKAPVKQASRRKIITKTAGRRLIEQLSKPDDPYSLTFLIEQAGHTANYLERINAMLNGERQAWLEVQIGAKTVEVVVTSVLVQQRQMAEQLRKLLGTIHSQRAAIEMGPDDNDDPTQDL